MQNTYAFINDFQKEHVYDVYYFIVKNPKPYDKVTRRQMAEKIIYSYFKDEDMFFNLLTEREWKMLFTVHNASDDILKSAHKIQVPSRFFICKRFDGRLSEPLFDHMFKKFIFDEKKKTIDEFIYFMIGLSKVRGIITLEDAFKIYQGFKSDITFETFNTYLKSYKRLFLDIDYVAYIHHNLIRNLTCSLTLEDIHQDYDAFAYTYDDYISVGLYGVNRNDQKINTLYQLLEKHAKPWQLNYIMNHAIQDDIRKDNHNFDTLIEFVFPLVDQPDLAVTLCTDFLNALPNRFFKGTPIFLIKHDITPVEKKVYNKYDLCPCGSQIKYKYCCLNLKRLLDHQAVLSKKDIVLFYITFNELIYYTNSIAHIVKHHEEIDTFFDTLPNESFNDIKTHLYHNKDLIDQYIKLHFDHMHEEVYEVLLGIKKAISGHFYAMQYENQKLVILDETTQISYALTGLTQPISEIIDAQSLPKIIETSLIPFKHMIVFDVTMIITAVEIGPNIKKRIFETLKQSKRITSF